MNELLQVECLNSVNIEPNANVIFDSTLLAAGNISYDNATGIITLLEAGRYEFDWWVATQASASAIGAGFALVSSQDNVIVGNSPLKTGPVAGIGIIEVTDAPVTVALRNDSNATIYYSTIVPVKASLAVIRLDAMGPTGPAAITAYGGLYNLLTDVIELPAGESVEVTFDEVSPLLNVTAGANTLTVSIAGDYKVSMSIIAQSIGGPTALNFILYVNGVAASPISVGTIFTDQLESVNSDAILSLPAGAVLSVGLHSASGGQILQGPGQNASLNVMRIGPPA